MQANAWRGCREGGAPHTHQNRVRCSRARTYNPTEKPSHPFSDFRRSLLPFVLVSDLGVLTTWPLFAMASENYALRNSLDEELDDVSIARSPGWQAESRDACAVERSFRPYHFHFHVM